MNRPNIQTKVICVTGGKGGIGKTFLSINLAAALSYHHQKVLLFDADLSLGNVDVALGLKPSKTLNDLVSSNYSIREIITKGPLGFDIIPASSGIRQLSMLTHQAVAGIVNSFSDVSHQYDILLIDTASGITDTVINFAKASHEVMVIVCNEPTSIADAYALIKTLYRDEGVKRFRVVANMVNSAQEGRFLFTKLMNVVTRFLDINLDYAGHVLFDTAVKRALQKRKALMELYPSSVAALTVQDLAIRVAKWRKSQMATGRIEFFLEQFVGTT